MENSVKDFALGKHLTAEYYDCNSAILADAVKMEELFIEAANRSGATVLGSNFHDFQPQGVSGFVVIAESHFSVHAWPEHDYAAVDIFTCGESIDFNEAVDALRELMESESVIVSSVMNRGIVGNNGIERKVPVYADHTNSYALAWKTRYDSLNAWGLISSIDLCDVKAENLSNCESVKSALARFCTAMEFAIPADFQVQSFESKANGAGYTFCATLGQGYMISGNASTAKQSVYIDIFTTDFYEPRESAEQALSAFEGHHYRMQVAVRR